MPKLADPRTALCLALAPRTTAVIDASGNANKNGGRPLAYLTRCGFRGAVDPVNPARARAQGLRCFVDLVSLPEVPDVMIVVVAGEQALKAVLACGLAGVELKADADSTDARALGSLPRHQRLPRWPDDAAQSALMTRKADRSEDRRWKPCTSMHRLRSPPRCTRACACLR